MTRPGERRGAVGVSLAVRQFERSVDRLDRGARRVDDRIEIRRGQLRAGRRDSLAYIVRIRADSLFRVEDRIGGAVDNLGERDALFVRESAAFDVANVLFRFSQATGQFARHVRGVDRIVAEALPIAAPRRDLRGFRRADQDGAVGGREVALRGGVAIEIGFAIVVFDRRFNGRHFDEGRHFVESGDSFVNRVSVDKGLRGGGQFAVVGVREPLSPEREPLEIVDAVHSALRLADRPHAPRQ